MKPIIIIILIFSYCSLPNREKKAISYLKVTAPSGLILRQGPGTNFPKIKTLPKTTVSPIYEFLGETIDIKGYKGKWILTEFENEFGYVFSGHVVIALDKEFLISQTFNQAPMTQFLVSDSGKLPIIKMLKTKNAAFIDGSEKTLFKKFYENDHSVIETISLGEEYYPKTFIKTIKGSNIIEFPDVSNVHPIRMYESGKIIEGEKYICYGCCATTIPIIALFGNNKSFTFYGSAKDLDALCYPEGGDVEYNRIRYSETKNELYIHTKIGNCNEKLLNFCYESKQTDSCKPKQFHSETFKVITNPFDEPMIEIYSNTGIPEKHSDEFKKGRKLIQFKVK
ncbi:SH3 domain-containing protein [Leptospira kanakyensis]|uniref:SH3 domain-containing protein n=1 Tax=Leptospira kanakyensis TaxID=2484968 RepID=A0A6N4QNX8_9LEPT|nr:SH3 domain-containing protein [Leptospira kanakyensis]TGK54342.1 SH3 domain-containing protein [Leptospira kanakyensis]TGK58938.1 SH3 domain-containing protein [Leptospira kanakyensis]TGK75339.1 SH3 domain-containing protein [Leptospira kanakyensis]